MQGITHHQYHYDRKAGTFTSYYLVEPTESLLPKRLCITRREFTRIAGNRKQQAGQLKATYTKNEHSNYKQGKGSIHSTIYAPLQNIPGCIGTGDLQGTKDLLIFQSSDDWQSITIHLFIEGKFYERELIEDVTKKPLH